LAKQENRGGKREGSGRKPKVKPDYDAEFKSDVLASISRIEKKHKAKFLDVILERVYKPNVIDTAAASIFKQVSEIFTTKEIKSETHTYQHQGPAIGLPPVRQDPALSIVKGGK